MQRSKSNFQVGVDLGQHHTGLPLKKGRHQRGQKGEWGNCLPERRKGRKTVLARKRGGLECRTLLTLNACGKKKGGRECGYRGGERRSPCQR